MITIKLKDPSGHMHTFVWDSKDSITEQCEKLWIDSPFACRAWACTACACRVISWSEHLIQNRFGEKLIDLDVDQFLTCIWGLHEGRVASSDSYLVEIDFT